MMMTDLLIYLRNIALLQKFAMICEKYGIPPSSPLYVFFMDDYVQLKEKKKKHSMQDKSYYSYQ
jgi:hypothetical protein